MVTGTGAAVARHSERCWRVTGMPDVVMFNGHHDHAFMAHMHDVLTVIFVTSGAVQIESDDVSRNVTAGDLVVIGAHQVHAARPASRAGWAMRSLHAPPHLFARADIEGGTSIGFSQPVFSSDRTAVSLFLDMHRRADADDDCRRHCDQIWAFVRWFRRHIDAFEPYEVSRISLDPDLEHAKDLIVQAAFDSTLIDTIAKEAGISTFSLIRRFRNSYGLSPHAWRMQLRTNEPARLLRSGLQLADVAANCGFADQAHMTRVFKKVYGVTPGQYSVAK
jgi:AraC-like DNA-binding protein/mannose-6-phosphate isomerase-like protein (cupin superfamily)